MSGVIPVRNPLLALAFPDVAACACLDRLLDLDQRRLGAARIGPDEIADQHEIRAGGGEFGGLFARDGKADAGRLEQFVPPLQALGDRLRRGPLPARRRVRRTARSRRRASPAAIESCRVASPPTPAMRSGFSDGSASSIAAMPVRCAPSAPAARHQFDMAVEQQRRTAVLDRRRQRLDARDHGALVGLLQPHQHGGDIGRGEQAGQACRQLRRIVDLRRREIEPRHRARRNRFGGQVYATFFSRPVSHSPLLASAFIRARWVKARWPAATFSGLPDHAFCGAACSARP